MDKNFSFKSITSKQLCTLGVLLAVTVVLSSFFTFRVGSAIKIQTKFIPVCITSVLFGPIAGGITAMLADVLGYFVNSGGASFLPQITFVELLYGIIYGLFLKNVSPSKAGYLKGIVCVVVQTIFLHLLLTTYFLTSIMNVGFTELLITRLPAAGINFVLQVIGVSAIVKDSDRLRTVISR